MTGGRLKRVLPYVAEEEAFCFTYGDGVADVNISKLIEFHRQQGTQVTLTATQPKGKFGALQIDPGSHVSSFTEKPRGDGQWVNGGFFVLSPKVGKYIEGDATVWEREPLERLARDGQVSRFITQDSGNLWIRFMIDKCLRISGLQAGLLEGVVMNFWQGRRVFLTGHTGFKGSWLSLWLEQLGAEVCGLALAPPTNPSLFKEVNVEQGMRSEIADIVIRNASRRYFTNIVPK